MQAKHGCILFVLLIGSIIVFTEGFVPQHGRKREVQKIFKLKCRLVFY